MHYELVHEGIRTPFTVIVRNWEPSSFKLTEEEKNSLGAPFIIKPALGYGQKGLVRDAKGTMSEIARARNFDRGDNFLLQEKINPVELGGKRAWFRIIHVFNILIPCWWDDRFHSYEHVKYEDFENYRLFPLAKITSKIAFISHMAWFSTEIAMDKRGGQERFVAIDYVNDQPELCVRSEKGRFGPVPEIVQHIAERIVETAWRMLRGIPAGMHRSIWLAKARLEDESI